MKTRTLRITVCPACLGPLRLAASEVVEDEIRAGTLTCARCGAVFLIVRGVPRFVTQLGDRQQIAESFGFQWHVRGQGRFETGTLYGLSEDDERDGFFHALDRGPLDLEGKTILEAGCGDGFLLRILSKLPVDIVGIDINTSIDRTADACRGFANVSVLQADLLRAPFAPGTFDIVWSEGVIVCTADPREAFGSLASLVKPGGTLYVWVYPSERLSVYQRMRDLLVAPYRLPRPVLLYLCYLLAVPIYLLARPYAAWQRRRGVPVDAKPSIGSVAFSLFDNLSPRYQSRHTTAEVRGWFEAFGFADVKQTGLIGMTGRKAG
ncbi:MAG: methyltransferase domain-containing protein [Candidatus Rokubacteria bacterium]|nr:methyltransferase domain-containing protein [Candidatus Rokubacteria bacterium]